MNSYIIIPIFNSETFIKDGLTKLLNQNTELICLDFGSTDNSLNILETYINQGHKIEILSLKKLKDLQVEGADFITPEGNKKTLKNKSDIYKEVQKFAYSNNIKLPENISYYKTIWLNPFIKASLGVFKTKYSLFGCIPIPEAILEILRHTFYIESSSDLRINFRILGIRLSVANLYCRLKRSKTPYLKYKAQGFDIRKLPTAQGQIREIQLANLEILKELDYVCKENNLSYWLDFGTLLGAVRHKGYIPWDDDIDVSMLRSDYEKIFEAFKKSSRNPDICPVYHRNKDRGSHYFIKVKHKKCPHLFVDIFPYDCYGAKLSDSEQLQETNNIKAKRNIIKKRCRDEVIEDDILDFVLKDLQKNILKPETDITQTDFVWGVDFNHAWKNWFTRYDVIFPLKTVEFEGFNFPCCNNPDSHLKRIYGNYMQYPNKIGFGHSMYVKINNAEKNTILNMIQSGHN